MANKPDYVFWLKVKNQRDTLYFVCREVVVIELSLQRCRLSEDRLFSFTQPHQLP